MAAFRPEHAQSLERLWTLSDSFRDIRKFSPSLAYDPSPIDGLLGARIPSGLDLAQYLDGMSNIAGIGVFDAPGSKRIEVVGGTFNPMFKPPALSIGMQRDELEAVIGVEVSAVPEVPRDRMGTPIILARIPMAVLLAQAEGMLAPEFYMETNLPEVYELAVSVGNLLLDGMIDFHGPSGASEHE